MLVFLLKEPDARWAEALAAAGVACEFAPVLQAERRNADALAAALRCAERFAAVALTSRRAAEALADALRGELPSPVFVVGRATSRPLEGLGLDVRGGDAGSAAALAATMLGELADDDRPVLFLCGDKRRPELPEAFAACGRALEELCVYETRASAPDAAPRPGDVAVVFSPSAVPCLGGCAAAGVRFVAIGATTAAALREAGLAVAGVAEAPTPEGVLSSLPQSHPE